MLRIVLLFVWGMVCAASATAAPGDSAVRQAQQAYAARNVAGLERAAREVPADHVLLPYVEYWRFQLAGRGDDGRLADFIARYAGSRLSELVRADWLKSLGARQAWSRYLIEYPALVKPEPVHRCYAYRARLTQDAMDAQAEAVALWFTGRDLPAACTPLFSQLIDAGLINEEDLWRRLRLALDAGNPAVAKAVIGLMPPTQRGLAGRLDEVLRDPARALASDLLDLSQRGERELALYALDQVAKRSSAEAEQALTRRLARLPAMDAAAAWARLAVRAARRHEPIALGWFQRAGLVATDDGQREWWARAALRAGDWPTVQRVIDSMTESGRRQPVWQYWRARALQVDGQRPAAQAVFLSLSQAPHYYGQLAQEELGPVAQLPAINIKVGGETLAEVAGDPGIARALSLYALGFRGDATQEWNWAIRDFSDPQLLAAAELARREEWYDRAINTAERTRELHDFELRFIAPYREFAQRAARENQIDEAWVFGLMRQESRFINVARSSVGASGLMQIMPATARWIAQRLGIKQFDPDEMRDPARNIQFGAYYLKHVQSTLDDSPVLATAAYNAGPGRAQRWRASTPMEAAIYIETIPFAETRDYVKKVMSNAMYYAVRFGQPSVLLKDRLGTVPARRTPAPPAPVAEDGLDVSPRPD